MGKWVSGCALAVALLWLAGSALAWEIPLALEEQWAQGGMRYVTGGVPLLVGQAKDPSELRLAVRDTEGKLESVPAQFRVLARWWRADNSIRWVLVDLSADMSPSEKRTLYLTNAKLDLPEPEDKLTVSQSEEAITITTGPARFVVSRRNFALLQSAYIDGNSDGEFSDDENLLATTADCGTVLEDTFGEEYFSSEDTQSVEVIEAGPLRVQVRARGVHRARGGKGYRRGLYSYDCFMDFYAGSTDVRLDLIIGNNPPKSVGSPTFEDASLRMKLAGKATGYRLYGSAPLDGEFTGSESVCLYQDSNGAETWQRCHGHASETQPTSFRGYQILRREDGEEELIARGDQARGLAHLFNDRGGIVVHTMNFWQQFPKGVELSGNGTLRLALFPRECAVVHYLEDASAKGHEIILHFYSRARKTPFAADGAGRTVPHAVADLWDYRVYPRPPLEHIAATGALTDLGSFTVPTHGFESYPSEVTARRLFMTDRYRGNGYGWQMYGSRWLSHGGHSSRGARQPIRDDNYLYRWYVTGDREWLVVGQDRSRHFRDVRCYRIEGQDPFGFKSWEAFRKANRSEDWTTRPQPDDDEIKAYSQGLWARSTWWLPNPAHMTLDLLYDRYLLFGDVRAYENMKVVAGHGGNFSAYHEPYVHRQTGWSWRALERYWELTGDRDAEQCLLDTLKNYEGMIGNPPLVSGDGDEVNWWFTQVFSRAVAMTALHTRDRRALELARTMAVGKEERAGYFCTLFSVLYHLTGENRYKQAVLGEDDGRSLLTVSTSGDFPATAHWLLGQPPQPME